MKDYYQILGTNQNATPEDIETLYKQLRKIYHPDVNSAPLGKEKFQELQEAYEILSNKTKRKDYDLSYNKKENKGSEEKSKYSPLSTEQKYVKLARTYYYNEDFVKTIYCLNKILTISPKNRFALELKEDIKRKFGNLSDFESKVEKNKKILTKKGLPVQSYGEKLIADFLDKLGIDFDYDKQITLKGNERNKYGHDTSWCRPDFYLTEFNIIIEYWGLKGTFDYDSDMTDKKRLYKEANQKVISIEPKDLDRLEEILKIKLQRMSVNI